MSRAVVLLLIGVLAAGCAAPAPQVELSADHPASPAADEAPVPEPSTTLAIPSGARTAPSVPMPAHHHHTAPAAPAPPAAYVCPMHPDVTSASPGSCPRCGMKLVPRPTPGDPAPETGDRR
jgi:hypothetical protein